MSVNDPIDPFNNFCNAKARFYPNGSVKLIACNINKFHLPFKKTEKSEPCNIISDGEIILNVDTGEIISPDKPVKASEPRKRSDNLRRTLSKVSDIILLNDWKYFFTGTLGDTEFDPTNAKDALKPVTKWLNNCVTRKGLQYLLIAEIQPRSKRIHWHGVLNDALPVVDSGRRLYHKKAFKLETLQRRHIDTTDLQVVYNIPSWRFGYSTAMQITENGGAFANYITKYITKENKSVFGRYYWSSKNIVRLPDEFYFDIDYDNIISPEYSHIRLPNDKYKYCDFKSVDEFEQFKNDNDPYLTLLFKEYDKHESNLE